METQSTSTLIPEVLTQLDYRSYLNQWFQAKKKLQPGFSGAMFAKKAGLQSHTILGMVIRGDRNLSSDSIRGFVRAVGLRSKEAIYFEKLVLFNQSRNSEDRAYYFEQLHSIASSSKEGAFKLITSIQNHALYLSHWYNAAIREMAHLADFTGNPQWIAAKLKRKITPKQASEALTLLLDLGFLAVKCQENGENKYEVLQASIDIDPNSVDFAIRNFHKEYLERAKDALDGEGLHEREFSSMTMTLSLDDLKLVKARIKEFRQKLNTDFPTSRNPRTEVVAINMQLLQLTTPNPTPNLTPGETKS